MIYDKIINTNGYTFPLDFLDGPEYQKKGSGLIQQFIPRRITELTINFSGYDNDEKEEKE